MKYFNYSKDEIFKELQTKELGLSNQEANERLIKYGKNKLDAPPKKSNFERFLKQLAEPMTIILIVAAIISGVMEVYEGLTVGHFGFPADVVIILAVVIINATLGVIQESKAEKAIESLQEIAGATSKVIRDSKTLTIKSEDLVLGDLIILEAGDAVGADARIIECASLKAEEAALTGESVPINKTDKAIIEENVPLGDRKNMVYMGSAIVYGRGKAIVTETGMSTEMGKIANALTKAEEGKTPLQIKLHQLSKILTRLVIIISIIVFGINIIREIIDPAPFEFGKIMDFFMLAISLAVAAIPEGLSTVVTIVLSIGVTNMSKRNAIIRKLTAVETLGCTEIICSDKTGTLTQNKMTVIEHFGEDEYLLANAMSLCSDAEFDADEGTAVGEPTECALVNYAESLGISKNEQKNILIRIGELPFDSVRKMMTTIHKSQDGDIIQFTKGAPDEILKDCSHCLVNGKEIKLSEDYFNEIVSANKSMADRALRVLAVAKKNLRNEPEIYDAEIIENDLCFIGLVGMIDPVRPQVKSAIEECRNAGIRPIMITGDHKDTAFAIANELGIIKTPDEAIMGSELDSISDEELESMIEKYSVYARVQPEHKTRIVNAWKKRGKITAMTGDGVNDAPSIKNADIGIGMGITGTDVTKNVADMVLADDNFATIVIAVGEGRRIYDNIRKAIQFLLASNLSEVLTIFTATLIGINNIFLAVHLLWINLITDCFPALALGMEKSESNLMKRPPRKSNEGIFANGLGAAVVYQGILVTVITLISYFLGRNFFAEAYHSDIQYSANVVGTSMAFLTLSLAEIFHSFNMRSLNGSIFKMKTINRWLIGAGGISFILTLAVIEIDFLRNVFSLANLNLIEYITAIILAAAVIPIVEMVKLIKRKRKGC